MTDFPVAESRSFLLKFIQRMVVYAKYLMP